MKRTLLVLFILAGLAVALTFSASAALAAPAPAAGSRFSAVTLSPDVAAALRAQGKKLPNPFPNSVNRGKKFNPQGEIVGHLTTAATQKVLVLFIDFATPPPGGPNNRLDLAYFDNMLFGTVYDPPEYASITGHPTDRTLVNYYQEVSFGTVDIVTLNMPSTLNWLHSSHAYSYYGQDNGFGSYPANAQGLVEEAVTLADPYVNFAQYAVNNEVPNLFVVHAGTGAEWSGAPDIIWSHSWDLTEGTGHNGIVKDGVKINNYAMMPEVGGDLTGYAGTANGPYPPTVGVYAHEYGHVLGLPDQYDYGYESDGTDVYSLMAGGSWNRYPADRIFNGNSPADLDAWSKYRLGFITPTDITSAGDFALPNAEMNPVAYKMTVPNSGGKEYFLFENRQQMGFDQGLTRFRTHGLAIYHVDDAVFTRNYWRPNEAENWKEFRSEGWRKAWTGETHYAISLIQADNRWDLEHAYYLLTEQASSLAGDLYPGALGVTEFSSCTEPNSSNYYFWAGSLPKFGYSGITVKNIAESSGSITANFSFVPFDGCKK